MTSVLGAASATTTGSGTEATSGAASGAIAGGSGDGSPGNENGLNDGTAATRGALAFGAGLAARARGGGGGTTCGSGAGSRRASNGGGSRRTSGALIQCPDSISACATSDSTSAAEKIPSGDGCFTASFQDAS